MTFPQDPEGTGLAVDLLIADGAWLPYLGPNPRQGMLTRVGILPGGMRSGAPSFAAVVTLDDGTPVLVQQSWRNMGLAAVALIGRWGTP